MTRARQLHVRRMLLHVHVDRPLQIHLAVLDEDRVAVLCDPVDRAVERPVEDDARRLAPEARVVLLRKCGSFFFTTFGDLGAAIGSRSCSTTTAGGRSWGPGATRACLTLAHLRCLLRERAETHHATA